VGDRLQAEREIGDAIVVSQKKKKLHHSSHIRLIRWTLPVSRDIGEHNEQAEIPYNS